MKYLNITCDKYNIIEHVMKRTEDSTSRFSTNTTLKYRTYVCRKPVYLLLYNNA